jgi:hypothetical protein
MRKLIRKFREGVNIRRIHICPNPPAELMAVIGRIGTVNVWEQRRCTVCHKISHWKRDHGGEAFTMWCLFQSGAPVCADMSDRDLRKAT